MDYTTKPGEYHASAENKEWYKQRNESIYADKLSGMSNMDLVVKYKVSQARIQYIVKTERAKHELRYK